LCVVQDREEGEEAGEKKRESKLTHREKKLPKWFSSPLFTNPLKVDLPPTPTLLLRPPSSPPLKVSAVMVNFTVGESVSSFRS